jgi:hypothetical protein
MRVNLITQPSELVGSINGKLPISLMIRPACGLPGDYLFPTDSDSLMQLLRKETSLSETVLTRFQKNFVGTLGAKLLGVELSDSVLTDIGYFID